MSALVPYNYGGRYPAQMHYGSHKQKKNPYYDQRFIGQQQQYIPRLYPSLPIYQVPYYSTHGYSLPAHYQFGRSSMSTDMIGLHQSNGQQRYAQYMHHIDEMQKRYWKQRANTMPVSINRKSFLSYPRSDRSRRYEKVRRILPNPALVSDGVQGFRRNNLRYIYFSNPGYQTIFNNIIGSITGVGNALPNIQAAFIPTGFSSFQQPYSGALAMPPFTFNRMSQPLCSLPLPPPLPQIGLLPLSPIVQQIVMQQYANPVAVLPFNPNWQNPTSIIPGCSQIPMPQPALIPPLNLQQYQYTGQSYMPSLQMSLNIPNLSSNVPPIVYPTDATTSRSQYSTNGYPSICRACVPAPPSLNIAVGSHNWLQHCSACRHTPADTNTPNIRPTNERSTPLLRQPKGKQNGYTQSKQDQQPSSQQQKQYPHVNASVKIRPWSHSIPAIPKGAVIISDQYISKEEYAKTYDSTKKYVPPQLRASNSSSRLASIATNITNQNISNTIQAGIKSQRKYIDKPYESRSKSTSLTPLPHSITSNTLRSSYSSCSSSSSSSCSLCIAAAANERKISVVIPQNSKKNLARKQLSATARNINLSYHYQFPDLLSVYHNNRYLKSSDTDSTSPTDCEISPINSSTSPNLFIAKEFRHGRPPSPVYLKSIKEEEEDRISMQTVTTTSSQSRQPVIRITEIRKLPAKSPSTINTISINSSLQSIEQDFDTVSTTSTIESSEPDDKAEVIIERF